MRILVVNDDGIQSPGLVCLARMAAGMGEVWVAAPDRQCSAMSQRISVFGSLTLRREEGFPVEGVNAFSVTGSPADCVKAALACVMPQRPDVVFSGINQGYNVGTDILYSGTVGAAMEALANGIPAVAFSSENGEDLRVADQYMPGIARELLRRKPAPNELWNVNFPSCAPEELKGVLEERFPSKRQFYKNCYTPSVLPDGGIRLELSSRRCTEGEAGSDMQAVLEGYISIGKISSALLKG